MIIYLFFLLFPFLAIAQDVSFPKQTYAELYMPCKVSEEDTRVTLSDGSIWKVDGDQKWTNSDKILIRWNNVLSKYYFNSGTQETIIDMVEPPRITVAEIDDKTLTLSDGSSFQYQPFIGRLKTGDRILITKNDHENGETFPYFLIGYTQADLVADWRITGEIYARLHP